VNDALVQSCELSRTFGTGPSAVVAVFGVSCAVHRRQRVALVGPSGSGKSTLLHLLAGIDRPTAGAVEWPALGGQAGARAPGAIGVVFQGPSLLPGLDATENVAFPLLLAGRAEADATAAAHAILRELGLEAVAGHLPEELSGGQAQRVAVARALVTRPGLVLADEPTGQLDHLSAAAVVDALLGAVDAADAGLLVTTHDEQIAARFEQHWYMRDGRMRVGEPACSR
jgi:predicted ABC-type transport system involved in lysophospholipase L1 biosynthesis ATPase subunit